MHGSVLTVVSAVLTSLSLVPGAGSEDGLPRALAVSLLALLARGLYLLFRHTTVRHTT